MSDNRALPQRVGRQVPVQTHNPRAPRDVYPGFIEAVDASLVDHEMAHVKLLQERLAMQAAMIPTDEVAAIEALAGAAWVTDDLGNRRKFLSLLRYSDCLRAAIGSSFFGPTTPAVYANGAARICIGGESANACTSYAFRIMTLDTFISAQDISLKTARLCIRNFNPAAPIDMIQKARVLSEDAFTFSWDRMTGGAFTVHPTYNLYSPFMRTSAGPSGSSTPTGATFIGTETSDVHFLPDVFAGNVPRNATQLILDFNPAGPYSVNTIMPGLPELIWSSTAPLSVAIADYIARFNTAFLGFAVASAAGPRTVVLNPVFESDDLVVNTLVGMTLDPASNVWSFNQAIGDLYLVAGALGIYPVGQRIFHFTTVPDNLRVTLLPINAGSDEGRGDVARWKDYYFKYRPAELAVKSITRNTFPDVQR